MKDATRNYQIVTLGYWAFTITDGAIRMLVVLYFHQLGYTPFEVAMLFVFYEFFGVVTNLIGGWLGTRIGLNRTMQYGMSLQIVALLALTVPTEWLSVAYVMAAQALSGIAKDLNKMSAKASVKTLVKQGQDERLFKWVAMLTGSKNALKGVGFFIGAALLEFTGFQMSMMILAALLAVMLLITLVSLPLDIGMTKAKMKFTEIFSNDSKINQLSAARFFLFGARDIWFVVALPVYLYDQLGWSFTQVGSYIALWIIGYGIVQTAAPTLLGRGRHNAPEPGRLARNWAFILIFVPAILAAALQHSDGDLRISEGQMISLGLILFGIVFAINSAIHSWLILAWSDHEKVSLNVGYYYMSNAGGRLTGTVLSGVIYQTSGLTGCLWWSSAMILAAALLSLRFTSHDLAKG